tara:strand:+ start:148 stop:534 length:387 start_codon:yes stop_codon:yes gene_type:complete
MHSQAHNVANAKVFISFSMPDELLNQVAVESVKLKVPLILNGLYKNSMRKTLNKIFDITKKNKGVSIQIDPVAFKKYSIMQVPSVVVEDGNKFDVITGNIKIEQALEYISEKGETKFNVTSFLKARHV